jgi:hypothetical protein
VTGGWLTSVLNLLGMGGGGADTTPPTVLSARFNNAENTQVLITFSESVTGHTGFVFEDGGGMGAWTPFPEYVSGDPGTTQIWESTDPPDGEALLEYSPGDIEDAAGNALAMFDNLAIGAFQGAPTQADIGWTASNRRLEWTA